MVHRVKVDAGGWVFSHADDCATIDCKNNRPEIDKLIDHIFHKREYGTYQIFNGGEIYLKRIKK